MTADKTIREELMKLQDERILLPKIYSFDDVRKILKLAISKRDAEELDFLNYLITGLEVSKGVIWILNNRIKQIEGKK